MQTVKLLGEKPVLTMKYGEGSTLSFQVHIRDIRQIWQDVREMGNWGMLDISVTKQRNHRSLSANAYAWVLMDKLAEKTGVPKIQIYRELITDVGGNSYVIPIKKEAVDTFLSDWQRNGLGWVAEILRDSTLPGYVTVIAYQGSSVYDTQQMARLIDLIVQECREQEIETMPPAELTMLVERWKPEM